MLSISPVLAALLVGAGQDRPGPTPVTPFPTNEELTAAFATAHPEAEILTVSPSPTPTAGALVQFRKLCGVARVDDRLEPFSVTSTWNDPATGDTVTLILPGAPPRPPAVAGWKTRTSFATLADHNGDGDIDRIDRNLAVMGRLGALMSCPDLRPPEGVTWVIKPEPDPAPAAQAAGAPGGARPSDDDLLQTLLETRPNTRIISHRFRDTSDQGARAGCGIVEIGGEVEPFNILAMRSRPGEDGQEAYWRTYVRTPAHGDRDNDGDIDRTDRNRDVLDRKLALTFCQDHDPITPPAGVSWRLDPEPDPDRPRSTRIPGTSPRIIPGSRVGG